MQKSCIAATTQTMKAAPATDPVALMKISMNAYPGFEVKAELKSPATMSIVTIIAIAKIPLKMTLIRIDQGTTIGAFSISSDI